MQNNSSTKSEPSITSWQILKAGANFICKYYMLCLILIYIIGTFIYVTNNLSVGFPFVSPSVVQYAILVFYTILVVFPLVFVNIAQKEIYKKQPHAKITTKIKIFSKVIGREYFTIALSVCMMLWTITGGQIYILFLMIIIQILAPIFGIFNSWASLLFRLIIYSIVVWVIILQIPISAGGLKPFPVTFCSFTSGECQTYTFFGEANGLYQFRDGDTAILQPTDSGYIKYDKDSSH